MAEQKKEVMPLYEVEVMIDYSGKPVTIRGFSLGGFLIDKGYLSLTNNPTGVRDVIGFKTHVIKDFKGYSSQVLKMVEVQPK